MMNKSTATLLVVFVVILTLPIFFITIPILVVMYNGLVRKRNQAEYAFSGIDVALQTRGELIPNLVETVRKYMSHEEGTLSKIVALRQGISEVKPGSNERFEMEAEMTGLLKGVMINVENYPDLKSSENMLHLQRSLNEVEEQISASRRAFNAAANALNNAIQTFPSNVMAAIGGFQLSPYFKAEEGFKSAPKVNKLFDS